jgi:heat shock factor-binding protein 1
MNQGADQQLAGDGGDNANELTNLVQSMLTQMQQRFQTMSETIIGRIDEMGSRIDDLEKSISDLVQEAQSDNDHAANALGGAQRPGGPDQVPHVRN